MPISTMGAALVRGHYHERVLATQPFVYWPLWEAAGTTARCLVNNAQNGTYNSDVSTWPVGPGIGDGNTAPYFSGNDFVDIYSATLNSVFNGHLGTLMIWAKVVNAGAWTDGADRTMVVLRVDASNQVYKQKHNTNDRVRWTYTAGGATALRDKTPITATNFNCYARTWNHAGNQVIAYYNGVQEGLTQNSPGAWAGALNVDRCLIGVIDKTPTWPWVGWLAHCAAWPRVLSAPELLALAVV